MQKDLEQATLEAKTKGRGMKLTCAVALLVALPLSAQARSERVIKVQKPTAPKRDTLVVYRVDTVVVVKTDTLTRYVPRDDFREFFVHDTIRDTVTRRAILPLPIPIPLTREHRVDCPLPSAQTPPAVPIGATVTPEPQTWALVATGLVGLIVVRRRGKR
jgi:hypothetical protein